MQEKRQWLTAEERDSVKKLIRYAIAIFGAVAITLVIVALVSTALTNAAV